MRWATDSSWQSLIPLKKWKSSKNIAKQETNMDEVKYRRKRRKRYFTGEDIDMFREREQENRQKRDSNICDTHIDGA